MFTAITIPVPIGLLRRQQTLHHRCMNLTGCLAILAGWLTIAVFGRSEGARRHLLAFAGTSILAAGMVAVGQGRLWHPIES